MAILKNHRLEYEVGQIDVTYPSNDKESYFGSVPIIVPNNWTPGPAKPVKGTLIELDGKQYRVLKVTGSVAEVLAMYDAASSVEFDSDPRDYNNSYVGKNIDTYCNNAFYSGLPASIKSAIVDKTFTQDSWKNDSSASTAAHYTGKSGSGSTYYLTLTNATYGEPITRHCYVLSVQDVLDYLDATTSMSISDTTLTNVNLWKMFWNQTTSPGATLAAGLWLQSADSDRAATAIYVNEQLGDLDIDDVSFDKMVHPAFQIDLSKVDFKVV